LLATFTSRRSWPEPGVAEYYATDALDRDFHADGPSPVLAHHDELLERKVVDEFADGARVLGRCVGVPAPRPLREPEAVHVGSDAAEAPAQPFDDLR
jgi:hypothetical protein